LVLKISSKENIKRLSDIERPKLEPKTHITHHISAHNNHGLSLTQDPATSDDSGRASERLTGSSVAPRDADSSRDRLSDASSRCSSGKGYIVSIRDWSGRGGDLPPSGGSLANRAVRITVEGKPFRCDSEGEDDKKMTNSYGIEQ
ncbi:hypothetical protein BDFB_007006, partial [Asbolus verrucosus]